MKRINIDTLIEDETLTRKNIGNEIAALYTTIEFILDEYEELGKKRKDLLRNNEDLDKEEYAQFKLLEHLTGIYNAYR